MPPPPPPRLSGGTFPCEPPNYGHLRLDYAGEIYFGVFTLWTALFVAGFIVFFRNRHLPFIRLKNVPLVSVALAMLHLQLTFDILVYPLNGVIPCNLEFWIMNLCAPLGIALFQAQNMQLLSLFWGQKQLVWLHSKDSDAAQQLEIDSYHFQKSRPNFFVRCWRKWRNTCILTQTYIIIGIGTGFQILVALVVFLISRRFHSKFGLGPGPVTSYECRAGWEWFPSGIWQAIWTYGFGPFIVFRIRNIEDTHKWKLQTTLAILFSLPALPLWSCTLFTPDFYVMNWYWPPNLWFVPGLAAMEFVILFFPLHEIHEFKSLQRKAREDPVRSKCSKYSVAALEKALRDDIDRLEEFAATKDFTGENIQFLKRVGKWKEQWRLLEKDERSGKKKSGDALQLPQKALKTLYDAAEDIFLSLVNRDTSNFPLNLDDDIYRSIDRVFGESNPGVTVTMATMAMSLSALTPAVPAHSDMSKMPGRSMIAPFAEEYFPNPVSTITRKTPGRRGFRELRTPSDGDESLEMMAIHQNKCELPCGFGIKVFDQAEAAVKHMVLTNTWIRYVDSLSPRERALIGVDMMSPITASSHSSWQWWKRDSQHTHHSHHVQGKSSPPTSP
ncbi:hypothetical protein RUND412_005168 [Rhizina undulata]